MLARGGSKKILPVIPQLIIPIKCEHFVAEINLNLTIHLYQESALTPRRWSFQSDLSFWTPKLWFTFYHLLSNASKSSSLPKQFIRILNCQFCPVGWFSCLCRAEVCNEGILMDGKSNRTFWTSHDSWYQSWCPRILDQFSFQWLWIPEETMSCAGPSRWKQWLGFILKSEDGNVELKFPCRPWSSW